MSNLFVTVSGKQHKFELGNFSNAQIKVMQGYFGVGHGPPNIRIFEYAEGWS